MGAAGLPKPMDWAGLRRFAATKRWSHAELARRLGVSPNRMTAMTSGKSEIPRYIALAVAAIDAGLEPYSEAK